MNSQPGSTNNSPPVIIEPLHHGQAQFAQTAQVPTEPGYGKMTLDAKGFLMKKMAASGQNFCSPTDTMVSPCTKKLAASKQRHYAKAKPLSLSSTFQQQKGSTAVAPKSGLSTLSASALAENQPPQAF